jgi:hypothetical protein
MTFDRDNLPVILGRDDSSRFIARLITKATLAAWFIVILSVVLIYRNGFTTRYLFLILGSILSVAAMMAYGLLIVADKGRKHKSWSKSLTSIGGFIPYLFGCYLAFYEGLYRLSFLLHGFSFRTIAVACLFIILGYAMGKGIYRISEFGRQVDEGKIVVE